MTGFFLRVAIVALGLWLATQILPGLHFDSAGYLLGAALLLGVVNAIVRPIAVILTLPLTAGAAMLYFSRAMPTCQPNQMNCSNASTVTIAT